MSLPAGWVLIELHNERAGGNPVPRPQEAAWLNSVSLTVTVA